MCFRIESARERYCIQWPWGANIEAKSLRKRTVKLHLGAMSGAVGGCVWVACADVSDTQPTMFSYVARVISASFSYLLFQAVVCHSLCTFFRHDLSMQRQFHWMPVYGCTKGWLLSGRSERRVPRESAEGEEFVDIQWVFMKILRHTCHHSTTQKHEMRTVLMEDEANLQWKDVFCSNADLSKEFMVNNREIYIQPGPAPEFLWVVSNATGFVFGLTEQFWGLVLREVISCTGPRHGGKPRKLSLL